MWSSASEVVTRRIRSLSSGFPGTMVFLSLNAPSRVSSLKPFLRLFSSGPWQKKHLSERMGRMSLLNCIGGSAAVATHADKAVHASPMLATRSTQARLKKCDGRMISETLFERSPPCNHTLTSSKVSRLTLCCSGTSWLIGMEDGQDDSPMLWGGVRRGPDIRVGIPDKNGSRGSCNPLCRDGS